MGASGLGPTVLAITWSEFAAGTVLMALRIYTNGFILRRWNPDFWWAFVSYVSMYLCFQPLSNVADLRDSLIDLSHNRCRRWNWRQFLSRDSLIASWSSIPTLSVGIHDLLHPRHRLREDGSHSIHLAARRNQAERETHSVLLRGQ